MEKYTIKVNIKDSRLKTQVDYAINATFALYRNSLQFGVLPVVDEQNVFHLAYSDEKKIKKWIELFIKSVTEYINEHFSDANLQCSVKENVITFKRKENVGKTEKLNGWKKSS